MTESCSRNFGKVKYVISEKNNIQNLRKFSYIVAPFRYGEIAQTFEFSQKLHVKIL